MSERNTEAAVRWWVGARQRPKPTPTLTVTYPGLRYGGQPPFLWNPCKIQVCPSWIMPVLSGGAICLYHPPSATSQGSLGLQDHLRVSKPDALFSVQVLIVTLNGQGASEE